MLNLKGRHVSRRRRRVWRPRPRPRPWSMLRAMLTIKRKELQFSNSINARGSLPVVMEPHFAAGAPLFKDIIMQLKPQNREKIGYRRWSYQQDTKPSPASNDNFNVHFILQAINHFRFNVVKTETNTNKANLNKAKKKNGANQTRDNNRDLHM